MEKTERKSLPFFKSLWKLLLYTLAAAVVGYLLLVLVFALPTGRMAVNLSESTGTFIKEGSYPRIMDASNSMLDNFTSACMLLIAGYPSADSAWVAAAKATRNVDLSGSTVDALLDIIAAYRERNR